MLRKLRLAPRPRSAPAVIREGLERRVLLSSGPVGPEIEVNSYTTGNQFNAAVATDAAGNFVVVWQSAGQDGGGDGIFGQRFSATGLPLGDEFQVNQYTTGAQQVPAIAMDADGDFVVAWQSVGQEGEFSEIWARRYTAAGAPAGDEFHVNVTTAGNQTLPAVAMDGAGNFVIAWVSRDQAALGDDVYARRYNADGVGQAPDEILVNTYLTSNQSFPAVAMDTDGDFVVVWQSGLQDGSGFGVVGQLFDQTGAKQGIEILVNEHTTLGQRSPSVAMQSAGDFVVAWESDGQDGAGYGIYARRYAASGAPLAGEFLVNTNTTDAQRIPAVAVDADGDFVITWASRLQDGDGYGIYAQAYTAAGTVSGTEFKVNTYTTNTQFTPAVAMDSDGDHVIAWHSTGQDGNGFGVYAQRFGLGGGGGGFEVTSAQFIWENAPQRLVYTFSADASASISNADLVLENLSDGMPVELANIALDYNTTTNTATFTFPGLQYNALRDGNYRATIPAASVSDPVGTPLPADHVYDFFFLNADANHDGAVNLLDFNRLASNFGQSPRDFTEGDFTYDGLVNLLDFNALASRFGTSLSLPSTAGGRASSSGPLLGGSSRPAGRGRIIDDVLD